MSRQAFIKAINQWDPIFDEKLLHMGYDKLQKDADNQSSSLYINKMYVVGVVDSVRNFFSFDQMSYKDVAKMVEDYLREYRSKHNAYLPRILIINIYNGRVFVNPTDWGILLYNIKSTNVKT